MDPVSTITVAEACFLLVFSWIGGVLCGTAARAIKDALLGWFN